MPYTPTVWTEGVTKLGPTNMNHIETGVSDAHTAAAAAQTTANGAIPATIVDAKGDLIAATAADTVARLAAGANGRVLVADSTQTAGVKWSGGHVFRAYRVTSAQSISANTWTKIQLNAESFDPDNVFDSTTNYRFTPTLAGYYRITGGIYYSGLPDQKNARAAIYKNGSIYSQSLAANSGAGDFIPTVSDLVYLNGTTDYAELYTFQNDASAHNVNNGEDSTYFSGEWVHV